MLEDRTQKFNVNVILFCNTLPKNLAGFELSKQVIRSSGSVGSNYRASKRAKSQRDFIFKIEVVLEEADESLYWLEVIKDSKLITGSTLDKLICEANELTAIFTKADETLKRNQANSKRKPKS